MDAAQQNLGTNSNSTTQSSTQPTASSTPPANFSAIPTPATPAQFTQNSPAPLLNQPVVSAVTTPIPPTPSPQQSVVSSTPTALTSASTPNPIAQSTTPISPTGQFQNPPITSTPHLSSFAPTPDSIVQKSDPNEIKVTNTPTSTPSYVTPKPSFASAVQPSTTIPPMPVSGVPTSNSSIVASVVSPKDVSTTSPLVPPNSTVPGKGKSKLLVPLLAGLLIVMGFAGSLSFTLYTKAQEDKNQAAILPSPTPLPTRVPTAVPTQTQNPFLSPTPTYANPFSESSANYANPFGEYANPFETSSVAGSETYKNPFEE